MKLNEILYNPYVVQLYTKSELKELFNKYKIIRSPDCKHGPFIIVLTNIPNNTPLQTIDNLLSNAFNSEEFDLVQWDWTYFRTFENLWKYYEECENLVKNKESRVHRIIDFMTFDEWRAFIKKFNVMHVIKQNDFEDE